VEAARGRGSARQRACAGLVNRSPGQGQIYDPSKPATEVVPVATVRWTSMLPQCMIETRWPLRLASATSRSSSRKGPCTSRWWKLVGQHAR